MERPWQSPVPPLLSSVCQTVLFPSDDERDGMVAMAWRGPKASDRYSYTATVALVEYLYSTSVAPLQHGLVQVDNPYCSEVTYMYGSLHVPFLSHTYACSQNHFFFIDGIITAREC